MRTHWYRLISAGAAAVCAAVLWTLSRLMSASEVTPLMVAALVVVAGAGLSALGLVVAGESVWSRIVSCSRSCVAWLRNAELRDNQRVGRALMAAGVLGYAALTGWHLSTAEGPTDDDQSAYLQTAAVVHDAGGPWGLIRELYTGRFDEANRHPLYIGLLSLHPTRSFGRGLSLAIGGITLLLLTWLIRRTKGDLVAGLFCLLLGTNAAFCVFSTRVVCEVLMVLWTAIVYLLVVDDRSRVRDGVCLGTMLGLAYLTKGTGLLLIAGYLIWWGCDVLLRGRAQLSSPISEGARTPNSLRDRLKSLGVLLLVMGLVISPLLIRNLRRFGTPFYNVNSQLLFVDAYVDPVVLAEQRSTSEAAGEYLRTHTFSDVAGRAVSGLVWESFILLRMLGPAPLDDARVLFGLPLALCALVVVVARPRREHGLLAVWLAVCVPLFAWYIPVAAGERFPLPLLAPLLMLAAEGIARLMSLSTPASAVEPRSSQEGEVCAPTTAA